MTYNFIIYLIGLFFGAALGFLIGRFIYKYIVVKESETATTQQDLLKMPEERMVDRRTWQEFRDAGLVWWVNRILHLFGWSIVVEYDDNSILTDVYPARVKFRGFSGDVESRGFVKLSTYLDHNITELKKEAELE